MKKYERYSVATEFEERIFYSYREALSKYCLAESATLYGITHSGDISVIFAK